MDNYQKFQQILDAYPSGAPESSAFTEILKILFTEDEVELAINMSFKPKTVEEIADIAESDPVKVKSQLETMADKVIILEREKDGVKKYSLLPVIPGLFEFPFMQGGGTELHEKLGKLWEQYHAEKLGESFSGNPTPLMRVVPVEKSIESISHIHPYEEVKHLIDNSTYIALTNCACRVSVHRCDKPKDVCLVFGPVAEFLVKKEHAKHITKEEAQDVLIRAEENGLVHTSNNSIDRANLICNCCPCCCTILRGKTELNHSHAFASSRFEAQVNRELCSACRTCIDERCPVKAIEIVDDEYAAIITENCIGCGLCASGCPSDAIQMIERKEVPAVPKTSFEMGLRVVTEKGKLDSFMKVMKK